MMIRSFPFIIMMMLSTLDHSNSYAQSGTHGGNHFAMTLSSSLEEVVEELELTPVDQLSRVNTKLRPWMFREALQGLQIEVLSKELQIEGRTHSVFDATNARSILKVNQQTFSALSKPEIQAFLLHELLGLVEHLHSGAGEWDHYRYSRALMQIMEDRLLMRSAWVKEWILARSAVKLKPALNITKMRWSCFLLRSADGLDSARFPDAEVSLHSVFEHSRNVLESERGDLWETLEDSTWRICPKQVSLWMEQAESIKTRSREIIQYYAKSNEVQDWLRKTVSNFERYERRQEMTENQVNHFMRNNQVKAESALVDQFKKELYLWNRWVASCYSQEWERVQATGYAERLLAPYLDFQSRLMRDSLFGPPGVLNRRQLYEMTADYVAWARSLPVAARQFGESLESQYRRIDRDALLEAAK
jgi:hypothetical protein